MNQQPNQENSNQELPAQKDILAASSPVFNAMFNGELKEKGDVKIQDASPTVFEKFLDFFYGKPMELSMENVGDILKIADKYDVKDCISTCVDFLKENFTVDDAVWLLHLALKFHLKDLKMHCMNKIQNNFEKVWSLFDVNDDGAVQLLSNPDDRFLSEKEVERVYQHICVMSKSIISKLTAHVDRLCDNRVIPYTFVRDSDKEYKVMITEYEIIRFKLTGGDLMLTDIFLSVVFRKDFSSNYCCTVFEYEMCIEDRYNFPAKLFHSQVVKTNKYSEAHVKLTNPIHIARGHTYFIVIKGNINQQLYTYRAVHPNEPVELTPTLQIEFPYRLAEEKINRSLISRMYFTPIMSK